MSLYESHNQYEIGLHPLRTVVLKDIESISRTNTTGDLKILRMGAK